MFARLRNHNSAMERDRKYFYEMVMRGLRSRRVSAGEEVTACC